MSGPSKIEWTEATWNPVRGCTRVSEGCRNCYAEGIAARFSKPGQPYHSLAEMRGGQPRWTSKLALSEKALLEPLRRRKPTTYFVNSMSDLFHEDMPEMWIDRVFAVMALCPQHTFQILTKRPSRMRAYLTTPYRPCTGQYITVTDDGQQHETPGAHIRTHAAMCDLFKLSPARALNDASDWQDLHYPGGDGFLRKWPLPNVWLGTSCEDQPTYLDRWPHLQRTPAAIRFISYEPALGPLVLEDPEGLSWLICGGESGPFARPMHPQWARDIRDQCAAAGVSFHFKQWGEWGPADDWPSEIQEDYDVRGLTQGDLIRVGKKRAWRVLDGVEHNGMPEITRSAANG